MVSEMLKRSLINLIKNLTLSEVFFFFWMQVFSVDFTMAELKMVKPCKMLKVATLK